MLPRPSSDETQSSTDLIFSNAAGSVRTECRTGFQPVSDVSVEEPGALLPIPPLPSRRGEGSVCSLEFVVVSVGGTVSDALGPPSGKLISRSGFSCGAGYASH